MIILATFVPHNAFGDCGSWRRVVTSGDGALRATAVYNPGESTSTESSFDIVLTNIYSAWYYFERAAPGQDPSVCWPFPGQPMVGSVPSDKMPLSEVIGPGQSLTFHDVRLRTGDRFAYCYFGLFDETGQTLSRDGTVWVAAINTIDVLAIAAFGENLGTQFAEIEWKPAWGVLSVISSFMSVSELEALETAAPFVNLLQTVADRDSSWIDYSEAVAKAAWEVVKTLKSKELKAAAILILRTFHVDQPYGVLSNLLEKMNWYLLLLHVPKLIDRIANAGVAYNMSPWGTVGFEVISAGAMDRQNPTGYILQPYENQVVGDQVAVKGTATDDCSGVQFVNLTYTTDNWATWNFVGQDSSSPYEFSVDLSSVPDGMTVKFGWDIYDNSGRHANSPRGSLPVVKNQSKLDVPQDGATFVSDVTIPDGTVVRPGEMFTKTWRVRNSGTSTWNAEYVLAFVSGTNMSSETVVPLPETAPGQNADLSVTMTAPMVPGANISYWRLRSAAGVEFGPAVYVLVNVQCDGITCDCDVADKCLGIGCSEHYLPGNGAWFKMPGTGDSIWYSHAGYRHSCLDSTCYQLFNENFTSLNCVADDQAEYLIEGTPVCGDGSFYKKQGEPAYYRLESGRLRALCGAWTSTLFEDTWGVPFGAAIVVESDNFNSLTETYPFIYYNGIYPVGLGAPECGSRGYECGDFDDGVGGLCHPDLHCDPCERCEGRTCGDDGLGGSCGMCLDGMSCLGGTCTTIGSPNLTVCGAYDTVDIRWTIENSPVLVTCAVTIGKKLTIDPGVVVLFQHSSDSLRIVAGGELVAQGTVDNPILLTSYATPKAANQWSGLRVESGASATIEHVEIEAANYGVGLYSTSAILRDSTIRTCLTGVSTSSGSPTIERTRIMGSANEGIAVNWGSPTISDCNIETSGAQGIRIDANASPALNGNRVSGSGGAGILKNLAYRDSDSTADFSHEGNILSGNGFDGIEYGIWYSSPNVYSYMNSPFFLSGALPIRLPFGATVKSGVQLTIGPSASIQVGSSYKIDVWGELVAQGTVDNPILLTSYATPKAANQWSGLRVESGASGTIEHVEIEAANYGVILDSSNATLRDSTIRTCSRGVLMSNASPIIERTRIMGSSAEGVAVYSGSPTISDCDIETSGTQGIHVYPNASPTLIGNRVSGSGGSGIYKELALNNSNPTADFSHEGNILSGNGFDGIEYGAWYSSTNFHRYMNSPFFLSGALPIRLPAGASVKSGAQLTIGPSASIQVGATTGSIDVWGELVAQGTVDNPILLTSYDSTKAANQWSGLVVESGASATLEHVEIEAASTGVGFSSSDGILRDSAIRTCSRGVWTSNASPTIERTRITGSSNEGIFVSSNGAPAVTGSVLTGNRVGLGVDSDLAGSMVFTENRIAGNTEIGVRNSRVAKVLPAELNDWGDISGPLDTSDDRLTGGLFNPYAGGDRVSDGIDYDPWLGHLSCTDENVCTDDFMTSGGNCRQDPRTALTSCDDLDACTTGDTCSAGVCVGGVAPNCDDGNVCTDDSCDSATGCVNANNTLPCNDGDACTTTDTCSAGGCASGPARDCDDSNICTDDSCDSVTGCAHANNTAPCSDDNACTTNDTCSGGNCLGGPAPDCDDQDACTTDSCNATKGCEHVDASSSCDDSNVCTDDSCSPASGCVHTSNTVLCNDNNACTTNDTCAEGLCVGGVAPNCDDENVCTDDSCDLATGCAHENNTAFCDDGSVCTKTDTCRGGTCVGGAAMNCDDGEVCTDDSCDSATGCAHTNNAVLCDDGNACTTNDTCAEGSCFGGAAANCDDSNVCTDDSCDPATGCVHSSNTLSCSDGNACTTADSCTEGLCVGGAATNCDDSNVCTDDSCDPASGCAHANNTLSCSDGNACTTNDTCAEGLCIGGVAPNCDDSNVCTNDSCDPATGCAHTNNTLSCSDGNACTTADSCKSGACVGGAAPNCNDGNVCTDDSCDSVTGCAHTNNLASCSDGNACTTNDTCAEGSCVGGTAPNCNDGDICTDDSCDPATGCAHAKNTAFCNDGNACTQTDICQAGTCVGTNLLICSAQDQCHDAGVCIAATGACTTPAKTNGTACDDGSACTQTDKCQAGVCTGTSSVVCTAQDQCHSVGTCNKQTGVCTNPQKADNESCNDGNPLTASDRCVAGVCVGGGCNCGTVDACCDGCLARNENGACDDDDACTREDLCVKGVCTGGDPVECPPEDACHKKGICNPDSGECEQEQRLEGTLCDDGEACTRDDQCTSEGLCAGTPIPNCGAADEPVASEEVYTQDVVVADYADIGADDVVTTNADDHGSQHDVFVADSFASGEKDSSGPDPQDPVDQASSGCSANHRAGSSRDAGLLIMALLATLAIVFRRRRVGRSVT